MKAIFTNHPLKHFAFRKDKLYHNGRLKVTLCFAFGNHRLLIH